MTSFFRLLPVAAAFATTPALAQPADPQTAHNPVGASAAAPAKPDTKPDDAQGCPMMKGQMTTGRMMSDQMMGGDMKAGAGQKGGGAMMAAGQHMHHCMTSDEGKPSAPPASKPDPRAHDHQHP